MSGKGKGSYEIDAAHVLAARAARICARARAACVSARRPRAAPPPVPRPADRAR
jgi:hypothetical protein